MQPQGIYNLSVREEEGRSKRSRVGLLHERTGVPVFLIYLSDLDKPRTFEIFSAEEVETLGFKAANAPDKAAWKLLKSFFESEGQHALVVASPYSEKDPLGSLIGKDKGLTSRTGIHTLRGVVEYADLVVVPQASVLLDSKAHKLFYSRLFELNTELDHFFILVDFPKSFTLGEIKSWQKNMAHTNAALYYPWLLVDTSLLPPGPVAAAAYQRNDAQYGIQDSPANRALPPQASPVRALSPADLSEFNNHNVNVFHSLEEKDLRIWGGYTLTDRLDFDNKHIATRRTILALKEAVHSLCEPFVLEPMVSDLAHTIDVSLHSFFQDHKKLLDGSQRQAFKTEVRVITEGGDDVVQVDLQISLPYVVNQMTLSMALTG
ncbi:MAG: hypothetical protein R3B54_02145 [Bdellovibrionota bacterium]